MQKGLMFIFVSAFALFLTLSFVSAGIFSDEFKSRFDKITGNAVLKLKVCSDSDGGKNISVKGTATYGKTKITDSCSPFRKNYVREAFCKRTDTGGKGISVATAEYIRCPSGMSCSQGACKGTTTNSSNGGSGSGGSSDPVNRIEFPLDSAVKVSRSFIQRDIVTSCKDALNADYQILLDELLNDGEKIFFRDGDAMKVGMYVVASPKILRLDSTANSSTVGTANDRARFTDAISGETIDTVWEREGYGKITVQDGSFGTIFEVYMLGNSNNASSDRIVWLNYDDAFNYCTTPEPSFDLKLTSYNPVSNAISSGGDNYILELLSATDNTVVLKVTSGGISSIQEIHEGSSFSNHLNLTSYGGIQVVLADESDIGGQTGIFWIRTK